MRFVVIIFKIILALVCYWIIGRPRAIFLFRGTGYLAWTGRLTPTSRFQRRDRDED